MTRSLETMPPTPAPSRLAPLGHPAWWAALALLLVNDNLLKGAGIVPGWLTGKLSDFAFLIVAPVVLAALLPGRLRGRRRLALIAVVGVYAAADLSPPFSDAVVALAARLGLRWRLWPDPTDLIALAVLPLTVHLLSRSDGRTSDLPQLLRQRAGVILGAAACLATSAPLVHPHAPFLLNGTGAPETVKVTWILSGLGGAPGGCPTPETLAATLNAADLDDPRALSLESGQVAALDGPPPLGVSPVGMCLAHTNLGDGPCVAAIVEAASATPIVMVASQKWFESEGGDFFACSRPPPPLSLCAPVLDPKKDPGPDGLTLRVVDGERRFVAGAKLEIAPVDLAAIATRTPDPDGCRTLRETYLATVASDSCTTNADCTGEEGLGIPGDPMACGLYVSTARLAGLADLERRWVTSCLRDYPECRTPRQPAVCRNGTCEPACPGVDVPQCPSLCPSSPGGRPCIQTGCRLASGEHCQCTTDTMVCRTPDPAAPGCPLVCVNWPGGGTYLGDGGADSVTSDGGVAGDAGPTGDAAVTGDAGAASDARDGAADGP